MPKLIAIMGPTGSGKSDVAERIAAELGAQLINADAFMVYRGLDIGTNKPTEKERYRLLDLKEPDEEFGLGEWISLACEELQKIHKRDQSAILVGGTGLYIRALTERWTEMHSAPDPELRAELQSRLAQEGLQILVQELLQRDPQTKVDLNNPIRVTRALERLQTKAEPIHIDLPSFRIHKFGIEVPTELLDTWIVERTQEMLIRGWIEEVQALRMRGIDENAASMRAIGYRLLLNYLDGNITRSELETQVVQQTRQYAKRQRTWLRTEPDLERVHRSNKGDSGEIAMQILSQLN